MQQTVNNSADQAVLERILAFKTDVENPSKLKTNQTIAVEDAVWLVEAALNYTYCITKDDEPEVDRIVIDSIYKEIEIENLNIVYSDVINIYQRFTSWMESITIQYSKTNMFFSIVDVYFVDNKFNIKTIFYYKNNYSKSNETNCKWYWGKQLGNTCGQYQSQKDASTEINNYLKRVIAYPSGPVFYTDVTNARIDGFIPSFSTLLYNFSFVPIGDEPFLSSEEFYHYLSIAPIAHEFAKLKAFEMYHTFYPNDTSHVWICCVFSWTELMKLPTNEHKGSHAIYEYLGVPCYPSQIEL